MRAVNALVRVGVGQVLSARRLAGLGLLALVPAIVTWFVVDSVGEQTAFARFNQAPIAISFLIVLPVVGIVLGSSSLGNERRAGTLSFLLVRPIRRSVIIGAKLGAAWLATLAVTIPAGLALSAVLGIRSGLWDTFVPVAVGTAITTACFAATFSVIGLVTERAVLIGLVYLFVWESGISSVSPSLANLSLFRIGLSAYSGLHEAARPLLDEPLGVIAPGAGGAAGKTAIVVVAMIALGRWFLTRRDGV